VHKETVRYYQSLGLVPEPSRPPGSVRRYGEATVARLRFIKRAQELGFTLEEVRKLLLLEDGQNCAATRKLAEQKLALIRARISDLARMRRTLETLIASCDDGKRPRACPIIRTLTASQLADKIPNP
jgi:MerR family transcriptional regulator, mercuric resistance operon regulatory protein